MKISTRYKTFVTNEWSSFNTLTNIALPGYFLWILEVGIIKHLNELLVVLSSANIYFDIIMLSETWLVSDMGNFDIKGYYCNNYYSSLNIPIWWDFCLHLKILL